MHEVVSGGKSGERRRGAWTGVAGRDEWEWKWEWAWAWAWEDGGVGRPLLRPLVRVRSVEASEREWARGRAGERNGRKMEEPPADRDPERKAEALPRRLY